MDKILADQEFEELIDTYMNDEIFKKLKYVPHHDSNRLDHSLKVAYTSYKLAKKLDLNYKSVAKAGLLHDFYFDIIDDCDTFKDKLKLFSNEHPEIAMKNALERFGLTDMEKNIITSHMWPASKYIPKYKESFIVSISDKLYSVKELSHKLNYRLTTIVGTFFVLFVTMFSK